MELAAKSLSLAMTDKNIEDKNLYGQWRLEHEVHENSKVTREALLKRGIKPENLNSEEDIKKIAARRKKEVKMLAKIKNPSEG